jgi:rRNA small subunit pseudouridine methyltransferase Nep1
VLTFILADAEVELAPAEIAGHPAIRATARAQERKPGEILLDQNAHGAATARLTDGKRRGRPDILHYCLLTILESPLNKAGQVRVAVHTRNGELLRIKPDTRLPRGEARFQGLIARVLREGRSQDKDPLIWSDGLMPPDEALVAWAPDASKAAPPPPVVRLDEGGAALKPADLVGRARDGDLTVVLGAFPSGGFSAGWLAAAPDAVSLWPEPLNAWAIAAEVVAAHRARWLP